MEMHQIRYFLAVAREGNFTRAARECNVSQPSLSRAILQLEGEFGGSLFRRESTRVRLTNLGALVAPFLNATQEATLAAISTARKLVSRDKCRLRIGVISTVAPATFAPLLSVMCARHPAIGITIVEGRVEELRKWLLDGRIDASIEIAAPDAHTAPVHVTPLFREQMLIALPKSHPLARQSVIDIAALDEESYVSRVNCEINGAADNLFENRASANRVVHRSERDDWAQAMIAAGAGFGFMPRTCITHPGLAARPLAEPQIWRDVSFLTVPDRTNPKGLGAMVSEVAALSWTEAANGSVSEQGYSAGL